MSGGRTTRTPRRALTAAAVGLTIVTLAGCVDQGKEVATYRRVIDASSPEPQAYDGDRDLSLVDALAFANRHNEQIASSGEDYLQALIDENRAVAGFLPTIAFQPSFTIEQTPRTNTSLQNTTGNGTSTGTGTGTANGGGTTGGTGTGTSTGGGTTAGAGTGIGGTDTGGGTGTGAATGGTAGGAATAVNAAGSSLVSNGFRRLNGESVYNVQAPVVGSLNLFRGGYDLANVRATRQFSEERKQLLLNAQTTVLLNVAQTYYAVLRSERAVDVLNNTLDVQQARLRDVTQQFNNGLATRLDVAQTRAQLDATRVTLVLAQGDVKNGRSTLGLLMGSDRVAGKLSDEFATPLQLPTEQEYEREALRSRQDLLAAGFEINSANYRVKAALAQYYPSVTLNVEGFLYRQYYSDASKWSALLNINLPIFSAGLIEADVRTAWSQLRQAALNESYVRRQALTDVRTAYQNLITADQRTAALRDEVQAASDAFGQSQGAFRNSLAINLDVLTSQNQLLQSQLDLAGAQYDRSVYYLDVLRASGTLTVNQVIAIIAKPGPTTEPSSGKPLAK